MSLTFSPFRINGLRIPNRIMRSATYESLADEHGHTTPKLKQLFVDLAKSGVGLIVAGGTYVLPEARGHLHQAGLVTGEHISSWRRTADQAHAAAGLIAVQLNHAGLEARAALTGVRRPEGPSPNSARSGAMSAATIDRVVDGFFKAGVNAHAAGVDAVQLHAAHGYLLAEFLSPIWNRRTDEFGGSVERRFEVVRRIIVGLRQNLPRDFPVMIKLNGHDVEPGGVTVPMAVATARLAEAAGCEAIEVSGGSGRKPYSLMSDLPFHVLFKEPQRRAAMQKRFAEIKFEPMFNHSYCKVVKKAVRIPVISIGGFRTPNEIEDALAANECDMVAMSRPFIRDRNLVPALKAGKPSTCKNCLRCFFNLASDGPLRWLGW
jgi:2,4-dienoyl-CoA reductase-like NADH-dependent reductase (Old Yellow Enzyme family)